MPLKHADLSFEVRKEIVYRALLLATPSVDRAILDVAIREAGHFVSSTFVDGEWKVMKTLDFGNVHNKKYDFPGIANQKRAISERTGLSTREVQTTRSDLLIEGDTPYFGSVLTADGLVVFAFSGVEAYFDEAFCKIWAAFYEALVEHYLKGEHFFEDVNRAIQVAS